MKINHYKFNETQDLILYSLEGELPKERKDLGIVLIEEQVPFDKRPFVDYPIFNYEQLIEHKRNRDHKLSEAHIETTHQLIDNYMLFRYKCSPLSKSLREMAVEKYEELSPYFSPLKEEENKEVL